MPFNDQQLAQEMETALVNANVMTQQELQNLLNNSTEPSVSSTLNPQQLNNFNAYWNTLGTWMHNKGGDIHSTTGLHVPGRQGGNLSSNQLKVLYNDAFNDVNQHITTQGFSVVKAVAGQLRFISVLH